MGPVLIAWCCFGAACAAFYAHYAITGRSFRNWPTRCGGGSMSRGYAIFTAINFVVVVVLGALFFSR